MPLGGCPDVFAVATLAAPGLQLLFRLEHRQPTFVNQDIEQRLLHRRGHALRITADVDKCSISEKRPQRFRLLPKEILNVGLQLISLS